MFGRCCSATRRASAFTTREKTPKSSACLRGAYRLTSKREWRSQAMTNKQADNLQYGDAVSYPEWQGNKVVIFATTVISFRELPDGETGYVLGTGITLRAASIHST